VVTDISGQPFVLICKDQVIQKETTCQSAQRNIQEEQRQHLHHGRSLKSNIFCV